MRKTIVAGKENPTPEDIAAFFRGDDNFNVEVNKGENSVTVKGDGFLLFVKSKDPEAISESPKFSDC